MFASSLFCIEGAKRCLSLCLSVYLFSVLRHLCGLQESFVLSKVAKITSEPSEGKSVKEVQG